MTKKQLSQDASQNGIESDHPYIYSIPMAVQDLARVELREDLHTLNESLAQFREWIRKSRDVRNVQTDSNFLLRFLRAKKFSLPIAQQTSELTSVPGWFDSIPGRESGGSGKVPMQASSCLNKGQDHFKTHMVTYETLLWDEETQIRGLTYFGDIKGVSTSHITLWSPTEFARVIKWGEQSIPARHKDVHFINVPTPIRYVYDFFLSRLSPKMRDRITIHSDVSEVQKSIGLECLPKEYGESWKAEMLSRRDQVLALDKMEILNPDAIIGRRNNGTNTNNVLNSVGDTIITGSFRKLEVD
ncbi:alpha-tocopherol transfer protein-like [Diaphorina citri]|uniref:Alpha-tocopherol transfer protein-like n=1 Tax=Diaphorina citri TaxID=121845 RepID=A0A3Q0IPY8_DIACI|nr:alpha-tocopherol transfer protein-like [Diaphorina citri]